MLVPYSKKKEGKQEKNAVKHCVGIRGAVCLGTGFTNYDNDDHNGRQRNDHRVHSGECDRA